MQVRCALIRVPRFCGIAMVTSYFRLFVCACDYLYFHLGSLTQSFSSNPPEDTNPELSLIMKLNRDALKVIGVDLMTKFIVFVVVFCSKVYARFTRNI